MKHLHDVQRAGRPTLTEGVENWESGISITITGCTFYRNFA